jgi:hypothetical protein
MEVSEHGCGAMGGTYRAIDATPYSYSFARTREPQLAGVRLSNRGVGETILSRCGLEEGGSTVVSKISKILCHVGQKFSKEMSKRPEMSSQ